MQRRRSVRKVMENPNIVHTRPSNIERRHASRRFKKNTPPLRTQGNAPRSNVPPVHLPERHNPNIRYSAVSPIFKGETVYLIGGGPSLKNFDFRELHGSKSIAINKAFLFHSFADVLYWTDSRFYSWYKHDIDNYKGLKYSIKPGSQYTNDIKILKKGKPYGLERDPQMLAHGFNSGYAAINLAYHLGAARIILLGFDMANNGDESHFHDGYPSRGTSDRMYMDKFVPGFKQLKAELVQDNVQVYNASPYSKINDFPKISFQQALSFR